MGRVVNTESNGKQRNQLRRTIAEMLRHLSQKSTIDDEAKDMLATIVLCLRQINDGIDESTVAWEKRDYWLKAENFRREWQWVTEIESKLTATLRTEDWDAIPDLMLRLFPHFSDINVTKFTREAEIWQHNYFKFSLRD
jgi:hypothetical protein